MKRIFLLSLAVFAIVFSLAACGDSSKHEGEAKAPSGSSDQKGRNYQDVVNDFKEKGFTNIKTETIEDLITGWVTKDGAVKSVSIDGNEEYSADTWYPNNVEVIITYHTFTKDKTASPAPSSAESATPSASSDDAAIKAAAAKLETTFPVENAKRAAVVALTNAYATDVFTKDGKNYDSSKFHSYSDVSGYFLKIMSVGTWTAKDDNMWHVTSLELKTTNNMIVNATLDVAFDGTNYNVSNITGTFGNPGYPQNIDSADIEGGTNHPYLTVSQNLIADDRNQADVEAQDHSGELSSESAMVAFENYGKTMYPYGFKCHWIENLIAEEQSSDGSWYFKVGVTVKNQYGTKLEAIADGTVSGTTNNCTVTNFYVN